ncbi:WSC domain-containing protein [Lactarius quietus]|nr:WSC domain-containing protein [Lactarius quietus]
MTVGSCITICQKQPSNTFFGVENGTNCFCGNSLTVGSTPAPDSNCNIVCSGNSSETCGGNGFLNLFSNGGAPLPQPTIVQTVAEAPSFQLAGCFSDSSSKRTLSTEVTVNGGQFNTTVSNCIDSCNSGGFTAAGLEFASQCFCGHSIDNNATNINQNNCTLACPGDNTEGCGGANAILIYFQG